MSEQVLEKSPDELLTVNLKKEQLYDLNKNNSKVAIHFDKGEKVLADFQQNKFVIQVTKIVLIRVRSLTEVGGGF